jgi:hypothetical protein
MFGGAEGKTKNFERDCQCWINCFKRKCFQVIFGRSPVRILVAVSAIPTEALHSFEQYLESCCGGSCPHLSVPYRWSCYHRTLSAARYRCHASLGSVGSPSAMQLDWCEHKRSRSEVVWNVSVRNELTLWCWTLFERPPAMQPLESFAAFCGNWKFITVFTRPLHLCLSKSTLMIPNHLYVWTSFLKHIIPETVLRLALSMWPKRIGESLNSPEDGNRPSFKNEVISASFVFVDLDWELDKLPGEPYSCNGILFDSLVQIVRPVQQKRDKISSY